MANGMKISSEFQKGFKDAKSILVFRLDCLEAQLDPMESGYYVRKETFKKIKDFLNQTSIPIDKR